MTSADVRSEAGGAGADNEIAARELDRVSHVSALPSGFFRLGEMDALAHARERPAAADIRDLRVDVFVRRIGQQPEMSRADDHMTGRARHRAFAGPFQIDHVAVRDLKDGTKEWVGACTSWQDGDVIGVAADMDDGVLYYAKNGVWERVFEGVHAEGALQLAISIKHAHVCINTGASAFDYPPPDPSFKPLSSGAGSADIEVLSGKRSDLIVRQNIADTTDVLVKPGALHGRWALTDSKGVMHVYDRILKKKSP